MTEKKQSGVEKQLPLDDLEYQELLKNSRERKSDRVFGDIGMMKYESEQAAITSIRRVIAEHGVSEDVHQPEEIKRDVQQLEEEVGERHSFSAEELREQLINLVLDIHQILLHVSAEDRQVIFLRKEFATLLEPLGIATSQKVSGVEQVIGVDFDSFLQKIKECDSGKIHEVFAKRAQVFDGQAEKLRQRCEQIVTKITDEFDIKLKAGELPDVAGENAHMVLSRIKFVVVDKLREPLRSTVARGFDTGIIEISNLATELGEEELEGWVRHELLHIVSGKSVNRLIYHDEQGESSRFYSKKSGLQLDPSRSGRFKWLNEAVTEWLNIELSDGKLQNPNREDNEFLYRGSNAYIEERKELDKLFEDGLEKDLIINAFFENLTNDQDNKQKAGAFAKLVKRINELRGARAFNTLENKYLLKDLEKVLRDRHILAVESTDTQPANEYEYVIRITAGIHPQTLLAKEFVYSARPILKDGKEVLSSLDRWSKVAQVLQHIENQYGNRVSVLVTPPESRG